MQSFWSTCEACIVNRANLQRNVVPLALPSPFPPGFGASFKNLMRFDLTTQTCQNGLVHQKNFQGEYEIFLLKPPNHILHWKESQALQSGTVFSLDATNSWSIGEDFMNSTLTIRPIWRAGQFFSGGLKFKATQESFIRRLHPCLGVKNTMWVSNRCES